MGEDYKHIINIVLGLSGAVGLIAFGMTLVAVFSSDSSDHQQVTNVYPPPNASAPAGNPAPTLTPQDDNGSSHALEAAKQKCSPGYSVVFSGTSLTSGNITRGVNLERQGPVRVVVCRDAQGELEYYGESLEDQLSIRLDACELEPGTWLARDGESRYTVSREQDSTGSVRGDIFRESPDGSAVRWSLDSRVYLDDSLVLDNTSCNK